MLLCRLYRIPGIVLTLTVASLSHAAIVYDESASSDLSNDGLAPTSVSVAIGSNHILGSTGNTVTSTVTTSPSRFRPNFLAQPGALAWHYSQRCRLVSRFRVRQSSNG